MTLQNLRRFLITFSMLLFPITIWYFSPYLIIMAAMQHIINGSFIVFLFLIPAIVHGKRASCHYICWMAPFMIFGYKLGRVLHLPQLKIKTQKDNCIECGKCSKVCKMSIDVKSFVLSYKTNDIRTAECILCGECVSSCPKNVLSYKITNK